MIQQWDFPVDEPVASVEGGRRRLVEILGPIVGRVAARDSLRTFSLEYGVSHEALRQFLQRWGSATRPSPVPTSSPRRDHLHRLPGCGRASILAPSEVQALLRRRTGESLRALSRSAGVSHETIRQVLVHDPRGVAKSATA